MLPTECVPQIRFDFHPTSPIVLSFDAPDTSSDAGLLLLRQVDDAAKLSEQLASLVPDERDPLRITHSRLEQIRQRVYQIAQGYEDCNDATALRRDPLLQIACDRSPHDFQGLSSQPSLSRMEHAVTARSVVLMQRAMEDAYVAQLAPDTRCVVLDIDTTADPAHGQQPLAFFHGHYGETIYFPAMIFDGEGRLVSVRLRPGNAGNHRHTIPMIERVIRKIKARFAHAQVIVRGDSGFATPRMMDMIESLHTELGDVDYVLGFEKNSVVLQLAEDALLIADKRFAETGVATRTFTSFMYRAHTWKRARYVIAKAERLDKGRNPRFVVTTLREFSARVVYEWCYCGRGQAENYIKDFKRAVAADRLSCTSHVANAFRLLLHSTAYRLLWTLRSQLEKVAPTLATVQMDTLRSRLLKVSATVRRSVRRIAIALPRAFSLAPVFKLLAVALGATSFEAG